MIMLSIGVRCGQGFDAETISKLIGVGQQNHEFDVLILGTNAGGIACAKEVNQRSKKTALVYWRIPTPAEEEGHDEDISKMMEDLQMDEGSILDRTRKVLEEENKADILSAVIIPRLMPSKVTEMDMKYKNELDPKQQKWFRKVRRSKIDLKNAIKNMAAEGRQYMHNIAVQRDLTKKYVKKSWGKMMEEVLDYIIQQNWKLMTDFIWNKVNIYNGYPILVDEHTVKVVQNCGERTITAEKIVAAVESRSIFPLDVQGAREFGINCDDFFRLSSSPGKTLIVGAGPMGMECAGILATFEFPVVVVYRSQILGEYDAEITDIIVEDLKQRGVTFLGKASLVSIRKNKTGDRLTAKFSLTENSKDISVEEDFDTVLFAMAEKFKVEKTSCKNILSEIERLSGKTYSPEEESMFQNIPVIIDQPCNKAVTELAGLMVGQGLFSKEEAQENCELIPNIMLTPLEYAFIGATENSATTRLGENCIEIYGGLFDVKGVLPEENSLHDKLCYAKVIAMKEKDLIIGLHLVGSHAVRIMHGILELLNGKMTVSNLPKAIINLQEHSVLSSKPDSSEM